LAFSDSAKTADDYFLTYDFLEKEFPEFSKTCDKLEETLEKWRRFISDCLNNNSNYEESFYKE